MRELLPPPDQADDTDVEWRAASVDRYATVRLFTEILALRLLREPVSGTPVALDAGFQQLEGGDREAMSTASALSL